MDKYKYLENSKINGSGWSHACSEAFLFLDEEKYFWDILSLTNLLTINVKIMCRTWIVLRSMFLNTNFYFKSLWMIK